VPLHTLRADIDYGQATAATSVGTVGVKVWVYKGDVVTSLKTTREKIAAEAALAAGRPAGRRMTPAKSRAEQRAGGRRSTRVIEAGGGKRIIEAGGGRKITAAEAKSVYDTARAEAESTQATSAKGQPARGGGKPASGRGQPARGGGKPASGRGQPARGGGKPASGRGQPARGGGKRGSGKSTPGGKRR
jgi:hypothetical protein